MSRTNISSHTHHTIGSRHYRTYATIILCLSTLSSTSLSAAYAAEISSESATQAQIKLRSVLHDSGITNLYKNLATTVLGESRLARGSCGDTPVNVKNIERFVDQALDVDQMMSESIEQLSFNVEQPVIDEVADWTKSETGRLIHEAEAKSSDWSDDEFDRRKLALDSDPDWNDARQDLIMRVLDSTATVSFVTGLHLETSALVLQAADCIANEESRALIAQSIQQESNDELFYSSLLRNNIHITAAIVFSEISDADLDAFVEYSQSTASRAWNEVLLKTIRQVLRDRHTPIQDFLAAIAHE